MSDTVKLIIELPVEEYELIVGSEDCGLNTLTRAVAHGTPLDDVKAEFINLYPKNYMGEPELGGASCSFSLNKVLNILDSVGKEK